MKITSTSKFNYEATNQKNNLSIAKTVLTSKAAQDKVSFSGAKAGLADMMGFIERKGFFAEFMIVDFLSMIAPRILIGLNRDRKETHKLNYKAGAEEALRELLSGPSMFLIPLGVFQGVKHFTPAAKIPKGTMSGLSHTMKEIVDNTADRSVLKTSKEINETMANKLFDTAFAKFEFEGDSKDEFRKQFTKLLNEEHVEEKWTQKTMNFFKNIFSSEKKEKIDKPIDLFEKLIKEMNNKDMTKTPSQSKVIDFIKVEMNEGTEEVKKITVGARELFEDFKHYSKDVVEKFTKQDFVKNITENFSKEAKDFLTNLQKSRSLTRMCSSVASFAVVGAFLFYLPKLYQVSKVSPAQDSAKRASSELKEGGAHAS